MERLEGPRLITGASWRWIFPGFWRVSQVMELGASNMCSAVIKNTGWSQWVPASPRTSQHTQQLVWCGSRWVRNYSGLPFSNWKHPSCLLALPVDFLLWDNKFHYFLENLNQCFISLCVQFHLPQRGQAHFQTVEPEDFISAPHCPVFCTPRTQMSKDKQRC